MRRYTTLWNCCVQKSQWPGPLRRELPRKTRPFKTSAQKHLPSDVSIISVHWRKIFTVARPRRKTYRTTDRMRLQQPQNKMTRLNKINVQSLTASVSKPQVVDSTPVWYLSITKSRLTRPIILTWCCYNSFCLLYVNSQASSSFSRTVPRRPQRLGSQLSFLHFARYWTNLKKKSFKAH